MDTNDIIDWSDKEEVLKKVKENGFLLIYASKKLKDDKEVVLEAVKIFGSSLKYASIQLKNDKEVVLAALNNYSWAHESASPYIKKIIGNKNPVEVLEYEIAKEKAINMVNDFKSKINNPINTNNKPHKRMKL